MPVRIRCPYAGFEFYFEVCVLCKLEICDYSTTFAELGNEAYSFPIHPINFQIAIAYF